MRVALVLLLTAGLASAQLTSAEKKATEAFILSLRDASNGGYRVDANAAPNLRATTGAVRSLGHLAASIPDKITTSMYVGSHFDSKTGAFQEKGGKPDVTITSIGYMASGTLKITLPLGGKDYLHDNAKTFEEVRIGAAGLEALEFKPKWLDEWIKIADAQLNNDGTAGKGDGQARDTASVAAMKLRLGYPVANKSKVIAAILNGQRSDGGWGKAGANASDLESTYRVIRALHLLKQKPKDVKKLNAFLGTCRNTDGGYSVEPRKPSTMSGVYYATAISQWLD